MGHQLSFNTADVYSNIQRMLREIHSPYNDGWTSSACKQELYMLKCFIEDEYKKLPHFVGEEEWEQGRLMNLLKKQ